MGSAGIAGPITETPVGSLNSLGYSPVPLLQTLQALERITIAIETKNPKTVIVSIAGPTEELKECISQIALVQDSIRGPLFVEVNLSCPNIPGKPPPAFSIEGLVEYFTCLRDCTSNAPASKLRFGIKLPPFSNPQNFEFLEQALLKFANVEKGTLDLPLEFITTTNTLGCALMFDEELDPILDYSSGIGGMAGAPLHALSLGNVCLLRKMLHTYGALDNIQIIGVGGVNSIEGVKRMQKAGAQFVGIGTALIDNDQRVFEKMLEEGWHQRS